MKAKAKKLSVLAAPLAAVTAVAALAWQLAAISYHGQLLIATGRDREALAAQTDWHSNRGLVLALAAAAMACAAPSRRGAFYSLLLSVVAMALYFVR